MEQGKSLSKIFGTFKNITYICSVIKGEWRVSIEIYTIKSNKVMKSYDEFLDLFYEVFEDFLDCQKIKLWNNYNKAVDSTNGLIYDNDKKFFDKEFEGVSPYDIAETLEESNWSSYSDYVKHDDYGCLSDANINTDIDIEYIAEYAYDNIQFLRDNEDLDEGISSLIAFLEEE